jgi:tRNA dimethylallyltransferase
MEPSNLRRIIRALEVIELTGRPFSENDAWDSFESRFTLEVIGLTRPRPELFERIEARVERMIEAGFVDEVHSLQAQGGLGITASQALGYKQILEAPDADTVSLAQNITRATKRFARRQESWFRADPRVKWREPPTSPPQAVP